MSPATSYQHCHDQDGEDAAARQDAIERRGYAIIEDKAALQSVIDDMLTQLRYDAKIVRVLAGLYVTEMAKKPEWFSPSLHQREVDQLAQDIADAINSRAADDVDARIAGHES